MILDKLLVEAALHKAFKCISVPSLIACHCRIHADPGALAHEVGAQVLEDHFGSAPGDADDMPGDLFRRLPLYAMGFGWVCVALDRIMKKENPNVFRAVVTVLGGIVLSFGTMESFRGRE